MLFSRVLFFFFKQKTAYEMRISDWSSDVCSSDLADIVARQADERAVVKGGIGHGDNLGTRQPKPSHQLTSLSDDRPPDDPPPRRLARPLARRPDARTCRALYRPSVRALERHAQPVAADHTSEDHTTDLQHTMRRTSTVYR